MFVTPEEVTTTTGYQDVTLEQIRQAQFVIELVIGRSEAEIDSARDKTLLARATSAQVVYMRDNPQIVFEQVKAGSITRGDSYMSFMDDYSPFVAPLAIWAMQSLSWRRSRSIKTGRTYQSAGAYDWRRD